MNPWRYFLIVFSFSWIIWGLAIATDSSVQSLPTGILYVIGGLGPTVGWIISRYLEGEKEIISVISNAIRVDTLGVKGLTVTACLAILPMVLSWLIEKEGTNIDFSVLSFTPLIMLSVVSVIEETGWRGYAYPHLNQSYNPFISSLIVGLLWSLWHLPLTLMKGTYQHGLGLLTPEFYLFFFMMISNSLIYGWLLNYTNQNVASSVLYHTLVNLTGEIFSFMGKSDLVRTVLITLLAVILGLKMG